MLLPRTCGVALAMFPDGLSTEWRSQYYGEGVPSPCSGSKMGVFGFRIGLFQQCQVPPRDPRVRLPARRRILPVSLGPPRRDS
jgi:hypothetical protein